MIQLSRNYSLPEKAEEEIPIKVVGVGDTATGKFIDGHQSRQDMSTLRQVAVRLHGSYHNGNEKHLPTDLVRVANGTVADVALLAN